MFYESISQTIILAFVIVVTISMFAFNHYQKKKQVEYKNDERWKTIQLKTKQVGRGYYMVVACLVALAYAMLVVFDIEVTMSLEKILQYATWVLFLIYPVEYVALRYFDKTL